MDDLALCVLATDRRGNRFDHMLRRFSADVDLIDGLRPIGIDRSGARQVLEAVAWRVDIPVPHASFHRGRGPHTGYCMPPRRVAVEQADGAWLDEWENRNGRTWPEGGLIRLGDPTALATIAHEFAHHMVHVLDRPSTPAHGKRWVVQYDISARAIVSLIGSTLPGS